ncbi:hypothetical protein O6H91_17G077600 [Diphasiastrum complanatum]|uniref:Uncharacterized protein n=1 Tax=Diphasiastrum complanatum TaxID=34168 RepID=A0ACC2B9B9_DIPCM|nr:hypothetical protein O6H91_17G077600 [Diphasiastrum complanatum]
MTAGRALARRLQSAVKQPTSSLTRVKVAAAAAASGTPTIGGASQVSEKFSDHDDDSGSSRIIVHGHSKSQTQRMVVSTLHAIFPVYCGNSAFQSFPAVSIGSQHGRRLSYLRGVRYESTAVEKTTNETTAERFEYQAEVSRLLDLIVHSLYSNKEVFLRELVSNASDALDKLRFLSVTDPNLMAANPNLDIRIMADPVRGTITILDSGVGMTRDELIESLGTIAQSGTAKFLKAIKDSKDGNAADNNLIGQFGVGFYSAFLVAEKVTVATKSAKHDKQYVWEGEADTSSYVVREETDPEKLLPRGTSVTLHLKDDTKHEYTDVVRIQNLVKNYSQFISFPIYTWQEKTTTKEVEETGAEGDAESLKKKSVTEKCWDWELANETKPLWMRNPKEVLKEEYDTFYKNTFKEYLEPLAHSHFSTEGEIEFKSLLYIPGMAPIGSDEMMGLKTKNIRLYVKRVFISDEFDGELLPRYLGFIKGVVDSNDLPLNVSREILQESRVVRMMKKRLVRKTFDMIDEIAKRENPEDYKKFWKSFGRHIKLGCVDDSSNHKRILPLLRFYSSKHEDEMTSLSEYIKNMKEGQKNIFYLASNSLRSAKSAPFLEALVRRDYEVLFLIEPIDEIAIQNLKSFNDKKFVDVSKEDLDLGEKDEKTQVEEEYSSLCDWMKQRLGDKVEKVQISKRMSSSPCMLVAGKHGWSPNMERLMKAQTLGDESILSYARGCRIMEINPNHPIIQHLHQRNSEECPDYTDSRATARDSFASMWFHS